MDVQPNFFKNSIDRPEKKVTSGQSYTKTSTYKFEASNKKDNTKKYVFAGVGLFAATIAIAKRKQIGKFFTKLFKKEENIASTAVETPKTSKEKPKVKEKNNSQELDNSSNKSIPPENEPKPSKQNPLNKKEEEIKVPQNIPKLNLSENTQPIMDYIQKFALPVKNGLYEDYYNAELFEKGTTMISKDIINILKTAEKKEPIEPKLLINILETAKESCPNTPKEASHINFHVKSRINGNKEFFNELIGVMQKNPLKKDETISNYFARAVETRKKIKQKEELARQKLIKSKLIYAEDVPEEKIKLTENDRALFINYLKNFHYYIGNTNVIDRIKPDHKWKPLAKIWNALVTESTLGIRSKDPNIQKIEKAMMQNIYTPYKSKNKEPVYRWLECYDRADKIIEDMPNLGEVYKYNKIQSCSKNKFIGEERHLNNEIGKNMTSHFDDRYYDSNIKFIIHPKSDTSKAFDVGETKYGKLEVMYPANTEFRILDKRLVEYENYENPRPEKSFYRWIVEMQEA